MQSSSNFTHNTPYHNIAPQHRELEPLNAKAAKIKLFADHTLSRRFNVPVYMPDEVARIIAQALLKRGDDTIWVNGNQLKVKDLQLRIKLEYPERPTKTS